MPIRIKIESKERKTAERPTIRTMSEMVEFRSSLGGFNKKDVNAYVARIAQEHDGVETELRHQIAEWQEKAEAAKNEQDSLQESVQAARSEAEQLREEAARLSAESESLRARISALEEENLTLSARAEAAEKSCREMQEQEKALREKADRYDATSAQLGDMIMSAKKTSGEILQAAEKDADQMRAETDLHMKAVRADAEKKADSALAAVTALLGTMAEDTFGEMLTYASEAQFTIGAMFEELKRKSAEISDRVKYISASSHQRVQEKLDGLPVHTETALPEGQTKAPDNENGGQEDGRA